MFSRVLRLQRVQPTRAFATSSSVLAGHNKWSKIKDKKGATDNQKSLLFNRASKDVIVAARIGGSADPGKNAQLAALLEKYKKAGVPKGNLDKALAKAGGGGKGGSGQSVTYEALGVANTGFIVECLTDNPTRTIAQVREILTKHEAHITPVKFMFDRKGCVKAAIPNSLPDKDRVTEELIEEAFLVDAEDFDQQVDEDGGETIMKFFCPPEALAKVSGAIEKYSPAIQLHSSELIYHPNSEPELLKEEDAEQLQALKEVLEAEEDVLRVWTSADGLWSGSTSS